MNPKTPLDPGDSVATAIFKKQRMSVLCDLIELRVLLRLLLICRLTDAPLDEGSRLMMIFLSE